MRIARSTCALLTIMAAAHVWNQL